MPYTGSFLIVGSSSVSSPDASPTPEWCILTHVRCLLRSLHGLLLAQSPSCLCQAPRLTSRSPLQRSHTAGTQSTLAQFSAGVGIFSKNGATTSYWEIVWGGTAAARWRETRDFGKLESARGPPTHRLSILIWWMRPNIRARPRTSAARPCSHFSTFFILPRFTTLFAATNSIFYIDHRSRKVSISSCVTRQW